MKIDLREFGPVWGQSGVQGFFGEGWWFHRLFRTLFWLTFGLFGFSFRGVTFVAKTVTLRPRAGNMRRTVFPDCVKVRFWKAIVLNAVGLTNNGVGHYLADGRWQESKEPFFISFMSVAATMPERVEEFRLVIEQLKLEISHFKTRVGIQVNLSCPNTEHHATDLLTEARLMLDIAATIASLVPTVVKIAIDITPQDAVAIAAHPACAGICVSNTVKWGNLSHLIPWKELWGSNESPLAKYGGGGLSGAPLLPLVIQFVRGMRQLGYAGYINAGGGILCANDVDRLKQAGADSVAVGSVAILRQWRLRAIVKRAHQLFAA